MESSLSLLNRGPSPPFIVLFHVYIINKRKDAFSYKKMFHVKFFQPHLGMSLNKIIVGFQAKSNYVALLFFGRQLFFLVNEAL